ncbi:VOC family protein [Actinoplanes subtropicus]|uniref:VOC family protein n=1 Tax=Actinoplanes subtropicus TaxID=543632 RepID=UPI0004C3AA9C|nr:VOC family protein [Actinoplanes subtropicus]
MRIRWVTGFLDTPGREAEEFWLAVTGSALSARRDGGRFATLLPADGDAYLRVQVVGDGPPRVHLDLHVEDVRAAAAEVRSLVVRDAGDLVVVRSPAGIVFCLVPWHGESRPPGGQASVVDQASLDVPAGGYEAEVAFWAGLTGWRPVASDRPEFRFLDGGPGLPLRLLLQRLDDGGPGVHLDLACAGVAAEVERHVGLGASVVRRVPGDWTTLRDPAGREYCVTARAPRRRG